MKRLLQAHFLTLFLNILLVSFCFFTKFENIANANVSQANRNQAITHVDSFLIVFEVMMGVQLLFTLLGLPFAKEAMSVQILMHIVCIFCLVLFILLRMHYKTIGYIWGIFCLIPFLISIVSLISKCVTNRKYSAHSLLEPIDRKEERVNTGI